MENKEGYMPFMGYQTYYRIVGKTEEGKSPIILLHGGPGSTHNYFELLDRVAESGRAVISYDQLGCGNSFVEGHPELWTPQTWLDELCALIDYLHLDHFHLLGQSWGGMLDIIYLIERKAKGVKSAILSSTLSSSKLWASEQHRMIKFMSEEDQRAIAEAEANDDFSSEAYAKANEHFMLLHCAGEVTADSPECLRRPKKSGAEAYLYGWGPNEYTPTGTLRDYDYTDRLHEIKVPCLIMSGTNDLCTPLVAKTLNDGIPDSKWELFVGARHMPFAEQTDKYCEVLEKWLDEHEEVENVRTATIGDLEKISKLELACFPESEAASRESFEWRLKTYPHHFLVMEKDNEIVSFVNGPVTMEKDLVDEMYDEPKFSNENGKWQMIFGVVTHPQYQHQGIAKSLMEKFIDHAKAEGRYGVVLTCKKEKIGFYEQFGFRNEGLSQSVHGSVSWFQMRLTF